MYNDDRFFPNIPEKFIVPALNPAQKKAWDSLQRVDRFFYGGFVNGMAMEEARLEDAGPEEEEPAAGVAVPARPRHQEVTVAPGDIIMNNPYRTTRAWLPAFVFLAALIPGRAAPPRTTSMRSRSSTQSPCSR